MSLNILNIVGARPNFIKIAPLMAEFATRPQISATLLHTGQHYDQRMSDLFFHELDIPQPDINLGIGSGSHAQQTAQIMAAFETVVLDLKPDVVLVVGDVNSTIACGLVAVKLGVKLAHVEAGLRSFDRTMPEEINRLATDVISDLLFCTEQSGVDNLRREGIAEEKIHLVGNVMIDTLLKNRGKAEQSHVLDDLGLSSKSYALLTLHRPSNVNDAEVFDQLLDAIEVIQNTLPIIFPIHPRTRKILSEGRLGSRVSEMQNLRMIEPAGYLDFLKLMAHAKVVLTDSGGIQEETTILQTPCLTLRDNTERPVTITHGTNQLVGTEPANIVKAFSMMHAVKATSCIPPLWDGNAAVRIVDVLVK